MPLHLIIFGPQGSGKGTQAERIAQKVGLQHCSTGAIFRAEMKHQTELGKEVRLLLDTGQLVSDDITNTIVRKKIDQYIADGLGFVLDGYPRTVAQAQSIADVVINHVILLDISDAEAVKRLQLRHAQADNATKRDDDASEASIKKRLALYHTHTKPLIEYYQQAGLLRRIDGEQSIQDVTQSILQVLTV